MAPAPAAVVPAAAPVVLPSAGQAISLPRTRRTLGLDWVRIPFPVPRLYEAPAPPEIVILRPEAVPAAPVIQQAAYAAPAPMTYPAPAPAYAPAPVAVPVAPRPAVTAQDVDALKRQVEMLERVLRERAGKDCDK
jgi:hypothetical protein